MSQYSDEELRMLAVGGPVLLRMYMKKEKDILNKIYGMWKANASDFTQELAEYGLNRDYMRELTVALGAHNKGMPE